MKFFLLIIFTIFFTSLAYSASTNTITGKIIDDKSKEIIPGATIRIEGTALGTIAKSNGKFILNNVPKGKQFLLVSLVGYEAGKISVNVQGNDTIFVEVPLKSQPFRTGEVVVSANKHVQAVQDVPISVSTFDYRSLQEKNVTRLDDALQYIPGVSLNGDQVSIRGSSGFAYGLGSRVAFLMDGMPLLSGDQADIKWDALPMFNLERIEVVKGAGSALYGTGAIGGVINLITEDPKDVPEYRARAYAGFYTKPTYNQWIWKDGYSGLGGFDLGFSQKFGAFGIVFSGGTKRDESYRLFDDSFRWNLFTKMKYAINDKASLTLLSSFASEDRTELAYWNSLDSATFPPTGTSLKTRVLGTKLTVSGEFKYILDNGDFMQVRSGLFKTFFGNNVDTSNSDYRNSKANSFYEEISMNNKLFDKLLLTYGLNYTYNDVIANIYGDKTQQIAALFAQTELNLFDALTITAGARADYEKIMDENKNLQISPKLGISYNSTFGPTFRFSLGKGFRAPTVAEKFASINFSGITIRPNPELSPEISWSYEAGGNYEFSMFGCRFQTDVSYFQNEFFDLIEPEFDSTGTIKFLNITRARIQGLECDLRTMVLSMVGLETSLTLMNPRDLADNSYLKYRSRVMWYSRLFIPFDFIELQADYRYLSNADNVDTRLDFYINDAEARVTVHVVDARFILKLEKILPQLTSSPITLTLNVNNLLNYYYIKMVGNLAPTRSIRLQIDAKL